MYDIVVLISTYPVANYVEPLFMRLVAIHVIFCRETAIQSIGQFLKFDYLSFYCRAVRPLYIFRALDPYKIYDLRIFSVILWVVFFFFFFFFFFYFLDSILGHTKILFYFSSSIDVWSAIKL